MLTAFFGSLIGWILALAALVVGALIGFFLRRTSDRPIVRAAKDQAQKLLEEAQREAESLKKAMRLESKEEALRARGELERENLERKQELQNLERRLLQREEHLDKKSEGADQKVREIEEQGRRSLDIEHAAKEKLKESEEMVKEWIRRLERISGMTSAEARKILVTQMTEDARREAGGLVRRIEEEAREKGEQEAKRIIGTAIQRYAADHVAETTVSVVELPNDEMKGRIIGREGRNIRALEMATGVDLIIDDTPQAVFLSGFDPVKREVARQALVRLVTDGRIHPGRIEEVVEKVKKEMDKHVLETGEQAVFDVGLEGIHPEILRLLGRLHYRTSYSQNVLLHSKEVAHLSGLMAAELGADIKLAKRAGLLHDIGKAADHEAEGSHIQVGQDLCRRYNEGPLVLNAIAAHHEEEEPKSLEVVLVCAADALSAARPGARREILESYIKRLEKLEEIGDSFPGVEKTYAIQAGREIRVIVEPGAVSEAEAIFLTKDIARKIEEELTYPGEIKVTVIRETRTIDHAH